MSSTTMAMWCQNRQLSGLFAALFLAGFLLSCFHLRFELLPLLSLDGVALLALLVELLFCAEQFDERLLRAVPALEAGANDAQVAALAVAIAGRHRLKETAHGG